MISLSVCIITKDEADNLEHCLACLEQYPFELIVVDTGSSDQSKQVARNHNAKVFDFTWISDFSAARNYSIAKASNEWILILDTDEFVREIDLQQLEILLHSNNGNVGSILLHSPDRSGLITVDRINRLFQKQFFSYTRPVHEQITALPHRMNLDSPVAYFEAPITVLHNGYNLDSVKMYTKSKRDLDILLASEKEYPDPYTFFQIGQCYYLMKTYDKAISYFEKALQYPIDYQADYVKYMLISYGYSLHHLSQDQYALQKLEPLACHYPNYADFHFLLGFLFMTKKEYLKAIFYYIKATYCTQYKISGTNTFLAFYNLGILYEMAGNTELAIAFHKRAFQEYHYAPSEAKLTDLLSDKC